MKKKILLIKLGAIGDVVHSSIIPLAIKNQHPDWEIHYMTGPAIVPLLEPCPYIDKVIPFDHRTDNRLEYLFKHIIALAKERYDMIFCLSYTLRLYLLSFGAFPKKVIFRCYKGESWVENYFYSAQSAIKDLILPKNLVMYCNNAKREELKNKLNEYPRPYILFNPGSPNPKLRQGRVWHINKWKSLAGEILKKYGGTVFVNGGRDERDYHNIISGDGVKVISGELSLEDSSVLTSLQDLVISGDSGPVHIASAFNVNTLAILGSTSPQKIKPYGENGHFIGPNFECKYCWEKRCKYPLIDEKYTPCIESISVEDVMKKIEEYKLL